MTLLAIEIVIAIVTAMAIKTDMVIMTIMAFETNIHLSGIEPDIKCKDLVWE